MIIVLKPHPTPEVVEHVLERIEALGLTPHLSQGVSRTIIGVIGDEDKLQVAAVAGDPRGRAGGADPQAVQAGQPGVPRGGLGLRRSRG